VPAFLEDHAGLGNALLSLYEATLEPRWLVDALDLAEQVLKLFWEENEGLFYDSPHDGERLVMRPRDIMDNATPSGIPGRGASPADRLAHGGAAPPGAGPQDAGSGGGRHAPVSFGLREAALGPHPSPGPSGGGGAPGTGGEALLGEMLHAAHRPYLPNRVIAGGDPARLPPFPLFQGREARGDGPTAYVCRDFTCSAPMGEPGELLEELERERRTPGEG
jgi:uncharacterized protein